jgi:hypothetical protein
LAVSGKIEPDAVVACQRLVDRLIHTWRYGVWNSMAKSPKKARKEAIAGARARLDKRSYGNELWQVILQYGYGKPDLQMADRATALVLGSILEQGLELAILSHCVLGWNTPEAEAEQKKLFGGSRFPSFQLSP